jgi:hypothetical protein
VAFNFCWFDCRFARVRAESVRAVSVQYRPQVVEVLRGHHVEDISAGAAHSACVVCESCPVLSVAFVATCLCLFVRVCCDGGLRHRCRPIFFATSSVGHFIADFVSCNIAVRRPRAPLCLRSPFAVAYLCVPLPGLLQRLSVCECRFRPTRISCLSPVLTCARSRLLGGRPGESGRADCLRVGVSISSVRLACALLPFVLIVGFAAASMHAPASHIVCPGEQLTLRF